MIICIVQFLSTVDQRATNTGCYSARLFYWTMLRVTQSSMVANTLSKKCVPWLTLAYAYNDAIIGSYWCYRMRIEQVISEV